jgi:hypothetical protein
MRQYTKGGADASLGASLGGLGSAPPPMSPRTFFTNQKLVQRSGCVAGCVTGLAAAVASGDTAAQLAGPDTGPVFGSTFVCFCP